jgi:SAM-dependent methyltransferase
MEHDPRFPAAAYYDLQPFPDDIPFYLDRVAGPVARVLELGCGSGRVIAALAPHCRGMVGVDHSPSMIALARRRIREAGLPRTRASVIEGDITRLELDDTFSAIVLPYRVFQALETDEQVNALMDVIRHHLARDGRAVLTMFHPNTERIEKAIRGELKDEWVEYEADLDGDRVVCSARVPSMRQDPLVIYPELIYRRWRADQLIDETRMPIAMRCWRPDEILTYLESSGFDIAGAWGGYNVEPFGQGGELVVEIADQRA